jgi:hypothetical protein
VEDEVGVAVLLLGAHDGEIGVSPALAPALGRLGVTHVQVVSDERGFGLIVEGWAFDPASAAEVADLLGRTTQRVLRPLLDVAIRDEPGGASHA